MSKFVFTFIAGALIMFAMMSEAGSETDIVARTVNFLLFAVILWLLIASPVRRFFEGRSAEIADQLNRVQDRLNETREQKETARKRVDEARVFADELATATQRETELLAKQIMEVCESDLVQLEKQAEDKKALAHRRMVNDVVTAIIDEALEGGIQSLDQKKMAEIVTRKAA